jgi:tagatose-6-phosphate ketose/aldose isomerase
MKMNPLSELLNLPYPERLERGIAYTPGEISQQPDTWLNTFSLLQHRMTEIRQFLASAGLRNTNAQLPRVLLIGAGTSDYVGRCLHHLLRQQWQCEVIVASSTSLLTEFTEYLQPGRQDLWISFSRSGDSPEGVAVLERALAELPDTRHLVVTCNAEGGMARIVKGNANSLCILLDDATNDRGLAMTSSFSNMVLAGQILAHAWSAEQYEPICKALNEAARQFLPAAATAAADLAKSGVRRVCFLGAAALAGTAWESALKLLELTNGRVKTSAESTLALRHGPMAALDRDSLLVTFLSSKNSRKKYELDLLREVGEKNLVRSRVVVAGNGAAPLPAEQADQLVAPQAQWNIPDLYRPVLDIAFGQLLGLFFSLEVGCRPDSPSPDGVISRVVQNVDIHANCESVSGAESELPRLRGYHA